MPWYRFSVVSNGGEDHAFRWIDEHLGEEDEDEVKFQFDSWVESTTVHQNGERAYTAKYEQVRSLPPDVRAEMIATTSKRVEADGVLLTRLREDELRHPAEVPDDGDWLTGIRNGLKQGILLAEEADARAARAWDAVDQAQTTLARYLDGVEKVSARQGAQIARERAKRRREHR